MREALGLALPALGSFDGFSSGARKSCLGLLSAVCKVPAAARCRAAMTTGDCCHLPGSLCDCPGSAALSKSVEDSDMGRPQFVTQVTAKDGRLLSTVIKALGAQSDGPICRICHEGGNGEGLLSPCDCTGTLGTVHKSCLEKWLSSSNTSYCELCHTEFVVERRPRPLTEWLKDPGPRNEKRTLFCDMVCFLFITPLAAISGWLCLRGAQDHLQFNSRLEAIGLIALTIALFTIYVLWTLVSFRYHCQLYSEWRRTNQKVRLMLPANRSPHPAPHSLLSAKLMKKAADETSV
ncbi:E3 ubiquitin-protein ligase MARCH2 [Meleagris gallopavo]|nr:E3 ubiquitin-protein ligase MARCH2 [Meleagris gallopavo]